MQCLKLLFCFYGDCIFVVFFLCVSVLRFVGPTDSVHTCSFSQMLEQRLENAFDEAQDKVLETYSQLTVEVQPFLCTLNINSDVHVHAESFKMAGFFTVF